MYVETDQSHDLNGFTRDKAFLQYELKIKSSAHLELKLDTLEFDNDLNCMFNEFQNFFLDVLTKKLGLQIIKKSLLQFSLILKRHSITSIIKF